MKPGNFLAACLVVCSWASAEGAEDDVRPPLLPKDGEAVLLFLLDNSASLPPLDPGGQRGEAHAGVDRLRRLSSDVPAWSWKGLSLVESSKSAVVMLTVQEDSVALPPTGFALEGLDRTPSPLIVLPLPALRKKLEALAREGNKDEQIYALNLEYVSQDMEEPRGERLPTCSPAARKKV